VSDTIIEAPPRAPIEWRAAVAVSGVDFADRTIEVVVVPYDEDTVVEYPPGSGKLITESVDRGAFAGIEKRPGRVRANRDHDVTRTVGLARAIHTDRSNGLVGEVYVSRTLLGDETLQLADDGVLGASVGMAVKPSDQIWSERRARRRIARAFLDHIALVPNPAYQGAEVLAVRSQVQPPSFDAPPVTPYLDEVFAYLASLTPK
jgi:HK97 family phage prohead protease